MRLSLSPLVVLLALPALAACGGAQRSAPAEASGPPETLVVRPDGGKGTLVAYDTADGRRLFALPAGMASADGTSYYAASTRNGRTGIVAYDPRTGEPRRSTSLRGAWRLEGVSPTGAWLAVTRHSTGAMKTVVRVVDARRGRTEHILRLDGDFEVETISADGKALFLIQHLDDRRYLIRLYDLTRERLVANPLRAKGSDKLMAGLAWSGLATPDGRWLLTLYLNTARDVAFIHALDLESRYPACIDLPSGNGELELLSRYTLALSPDGRRLFAANASLGAIAEIDLQSLRVVRSVEFAPQRAKRSEEARSVVSPDGSTLFFASGGEVRAYDTRTGRVTGPRDVGGDVTGLGTSADGKRLYVARDGAGLLTLTA